MRRGRIIIFGAVGRIITGGRVNTLPDKSATILINTKKQLKLKSTNSFTGGRVNTMPDKSETIFVKSEINQKFKVWIVGRIITGARVDTLPDKSETIPINQKNFKTKKLA